VGPKASHKHGESTMLVLRPKASNVVDSGGVGG
jgi:hypothetical protein